MARKKLTPDNIAEHIDALFEENPARYMPSKWVFRMVRNGVNATNLAKGAGLREPRSGYMWLPLIKQKLGITNNEKPHTD